MDSINKPAELASEFADRSRRGFFPAEIYTVPRCSLTVLPEFPKNGSKCPPLSRFWCVCRQRRLPELSDLNQPGQVRIGLVKYLPQQRRQSDSIAPVAQRELLGENRSGRSGQQFGPDGIDLCFRDLRQLFCVPHQQCHIAQPIDSPWVPGRHIVQTL